MRVVVLIFGLLGAAGSGFLGVKWLSDANNLKKEIDLVRKVGEATKDAKVNAEVEKLDRTINTAYALLGAAALGAVGSVLALNRKGLIAGVLFLAGFAIPLALFQDAKLIIFTFGLGIAGVFSFLIKPGTPYKPAKAAPGISEDDDMVG
jgi:hypothetical protein